MVDVFKVVVCKACDAVCELKFNSGNPKFVCTKCRTIMYKKSQYKMVKRKENNELR